MTQTLAVARPWHVKTPIVIRYLDTEYVDAFFETGELRLSSFAQFAKHPDEERGDRGEGRNIIDFVTEDGNEGYVVMSHGYNSLVLCGSTIESAELQQRFGTTSYFRILDTTAFGRAVAFAVPAFIGGLEGLCVYQDKRVIEKHGMPALDVEAAKNAKLNTPGPLHDYLQKVAGLDPYLVKLSKYSAQSEYRFIFNTSMRVEGAFTVRAPDARQFCQRSFSEAVTRP